MHRGTSLKIQIFLKYRLACFSQNAIHLKIKPGSGKKDHWLDHSVEKYGVELVHEIKSVLRVLSMFVPIPLYWALSEQSGSTWVFQARQMDGNVGFYTILPDQMQVLETFVYLACIPLFQYVVYPIFNKLNFLRRPLQKIIAGGFLLAASFVMSAIISMNLESTTATLQGTGQLRIYNTLPCDINISSSQINASMFSIAQGEYYKNTDLIVEGNQSYPFTLTSTCSNFSGSFFLYENYNVGYYFKNVNTETILFIEELSKQDEGLPRVR